MAWQKGLIPLSSNAVEKAITLNGVAVQQALMPSAGVGNGLLMQVRLTGKLLQLEDRSGLGAVQPSHRIG